MDSTVVRTVMARQPARHRTTATMPGTLARAGAPHPMLRTASVRPPPTSLVRVRSDARDPLVRLRYTPFVQLCYRDVFP